MPASHTMPHHPHPEKILDFTFPRGWFRSIRNMIRTLRAAATPPACVIIFILASVSASAQQTTTNLVAGKPILLHATTPLGRAEIEIAAGMALTNFKIQGDRVSVWQGPFTGTVALADVQPPTPEPPPTPAPTPEPSPITTPTPNATPPPPRGSSLAWGFDSGSWPSWVFPAAVGALAIYALLATLALIRLRHSSSPVPPPSTILPNPNIAKPAAVSQDDRIIQCPLCNTDLPARQLVAGRNTCPSCKGDFQCE